MRLLVSLYIILAATLAATQPMPSAETSTEAAAKTELETGQRTEEESVSKSMHSGHTEEAVEESVTIQQFEVQNFTEDGIMARADVGDARQQGTPVQVITTAPLGGRTTKKPKKGNSAMSMIIVIIIVVVLCCLLIICLPLLCLCFGCCGLAMSPCLACSPCCGDEEGGCCGAGHDDD
ncbi:uncharacterized protein [Drosophila kikkawai]|uniref:Uncharacterized protein n=1 Tax=Drosophila kikkawai TaxID=30033 RepID=A0A6P4IMX4_DROKI|nr:uncharacterized protein LOC108076028 [Drosophila kikkawai]